MIGEDINGPNKLDQAKEAVQAATQTVKETTRSVADAIEAGRQSGAAVDRLARWAQEAPLHAVTVAFLIGVLLGRRRRQLANAFKRYAEGRFSPLGRRRSRVWTSYGLPYARAIGCAEKRSSKRQRAFLV